MPILHILGSLHQRRLFKATVILVPVMGFTWIIGLFAVGEEGKVFAYLFVIASAFQVRNLQVHNIYVGIYIYDN